MLSQEENERLTRVGPETPMGELLRRYWYPVALTRELDAFPVQRVRLLGEEFAVYKTRSGAYGIMQERCPHRGASMVHGCPEENGLRCGYHGWLFGLDGACLEQPAEPSESNFRHRVRVFAREAQEMGGLVWAYIGPPPVPCLPRYAGYVMDGVRDIGHATLPCSWLQIMENSVDPYHVEWLHGYYFNWLGTKRGFEAPSTFQKKHLKAGYSVFDHGIIKRRVLTGQTEESDDWKVGHPLVFPYKMWVGGNGIYQFQIRVPVDDTTTRVMFYSVHAPDGAELPREPVCVDYPFPWKDERGEHIVDYIEGQDIMAWVTQGPIATRTMEHLGRSDEGVILLRKMFRENMARVEDGQDPIAVQRAPHAPIDLPLERSKFGAGVEFALQWLARGSMRYSPNVEALRSLHLDAAARRGERVPVPA